jgi:hypothetical protein
MEFSSRVVISKMLSNRSWHGQFTSAGQVAFIAARVFSGENGTQPYPDRIEYRARDGS